MVHFHELQVQPLLDAVVPPLLIQNAFQQRRRHEAIHLTGVPRCYNFHDDTN